MNKIKWMNFMRMIKILKLDFIKDFKPVFVNEVEFDNLEKMKNKLWNY